MEGAQVPYPCLDPNGFLFLESTPLRLRIIPLLAILASSFLAPACSWLAPRGLNEGDRRQTVSRFREAIEHAAGTRVWVKRGGSGKFPPPRAGTPIEVLVLPVAFDAVMSAIRAEAESEGLEVRSRVRRSLGPRRSAELRVLLGNKPVCRWRLREIGKLNRAAIVIDDLGGDLEPVRRLSSLPYAVTFSILPHLDHSIETAERARREGYEVMLHLPMEPEPGSPLTAGEGAIRVGMSNEAVERAIQADLDSVPHAVGVNNHMGSRATAQPRVMMAVMQVLARHHLYFVDSRTTASSVAWEVAHRLGVPAFYRSVFLDDTETTPYTLRQLREFRRVVEHQGAAVAIGHPYPTTLSALAQFLPELDRNDIQLVPVSELVHLPEIAGLTPPSRSAP